MATHGKKFQEAAKLVDRDKAYMPQEAVEIAKKAAFAKFDETVEMHLHMGVDARQADQQVRGVAGAARPRAGAAAPSLQMFLGFCAPESTRRPAPPPAAQSRPAAMEAGQGPRQGQSGRLFAGALSGRGEAPRPATR